MDAVAAREARCKSKVSGLRLRFAAASLPVAGNSYILAHHFGVAVHRVSAAILISTAASIATVPVVIHWITKG